jgi:hypothetical protein
LLLPFLLAAALTPGVIGEQAQLVEERKLEEGSASQGVALTKEFYFASNSQTICRFDKQWKLLEEKTIRIKGVNHVGAIDCHDGFIWAGLLHGPEAGKHDPKLDRAVIAKIRQSDLEVVQTWDLSDDVTWIDPVCFDGKALWVGDLSDQGIHRYELVDGKLVRQGVFRYPNAMHFSQGIRVVGNKLYSIHTFGTMDGLFEFEIPAELTESPIVPQRVWSIEEKHSHLEGFDFLPEKPNEIWHAQGKHVHRYQLDGLPSEGGNR